MHENKAVKRGMKAGLQPEEIYVYTVCRLAVLHALWNIAVNRFFQGDFILLNLADLQCWLEKSDFQINMEM